MSPVEQVIAELTARRLAAQDTVDECDHALAALRKLLEPMLPLEPPKRRGRRLTVKVKNGRVVVKARRRSPSGSTAAARAAAVMQLIATRGRLRRCEIAAALPQFRNKEIGNTLNRQRLGGELARDGVFWFKP